MCGRSQMVRSRAVSEVRVDDDAQSLQLVEVAVDGGQVDVRSLLLDLCGQVFRRVVGLGLEECPQQETPGGSDPPSLPAHDVQDAFDSGSVSRLDGGRTLRLAHATTLCGDPAGTVWVCSATERHAVHELSLCDAILGTTMKHAEGRPVTQVTVRIGHLRQVVPDALRFGWEVLTEPTELRGCELVVEQIPASVECQGCGAVSTLDLPVLMCGTCGSFDVTLLTGEEFLIVAMELAEA
jgi:hydrogenase nickel incorporation protein HypA/HybF